MIRGTLLVLLGKLAFLVSSEKYNYPEKLTDDFTTEPGSGLNWIKTLLPLRQPSETPLYVELGESSPTSEKDKLDSLGKTTPLKSKYFTSYEGCIID